MNSPYLLVLRAMHRQVESANSIGLGGENDIEMARLEAQLRNVRARLAGLELWQGEVAQMVHRGASQTRKRAR